MISLQKKSLKIMAAFALLLSVLVPLINFYVVFPSFSKSVITQAESNSVQLANHLSLALLDDKDELTQHRIDLWAAQEVDALLSNFQLLKLRIFSATGEILFSSRSEEIGDVNTTPYFHEIVAKGKVYSKSVSKDQKSVEGDTYHLDIVETYVPLVKSEKFTGALEIYQDITKTQELLRKSLYWAVGLPMGVMILFVIVFIGGIVQVDRFIKLQLETENRLNGQQKILEEDKKKQLALFAKVEQAKKEWEATMDCVEDMVMMTDTTFKISRCNKAVLSYSCLGFNDILGKSFMDIFPDKENDQEKSFEKGFDFYNTLTDQWFFISVYPLKENEKVLGFVITANDTTAVKKFSITLEEKNREIETNRQKLQVALTSISDLISKVVNEKTFDVLFVNPTLKRCYQVKNCGQEDCPCFGEEPSRCWQIQGTFCSGQISSDHEKRECLKCEHYLSTIEDPIYQIGEQFNNMMYILAEKNHEVEAAYAELKATQGQLLQQEKMASIGQLAAGVAHEINNPMGFIGSNISTLHKYVNKIKEFIDVQAESLHKLVTDPEALTSVEESRQRLKLDFVLEDISELIEESLDGCDRVKKIVMDLKGFSRVDQAEQQKVNLNECIDTTLSIVRNELKYKVTLEKEYGELTAIECYPQQLNQVFMNILMNAAQSIADVGTITIKTWQDTDFVYTSITDTGSGMPEEVRKKIFEPFFTTKEVGKGTGLGLSIVYDIIAKNHNGDISVESKEGEGSCFTIKIPLNN